MGEENGMAEIEKWLEIYHQAMEREFGDRILFLGIQGSYGRGEATETSDIDVVLILDHMEFEDLERYRKRAEHLPEWESLCGFVAGKEELESWDPADRFQFFFDTVPVYGKLEDLISKPSRCHAKQAALTGACNLYHGCSHNYLHTRNPDILAALYKTARFTLRACYFYENGSYVAKDRELLSLLSGKDREIMETAARQTERGEEELERDSRLLLEWSAGLLRRYGGGAKE